MAFEPIARADRPPRRRQRLLPVVVTLTAILMLGTGAFALLTGTQGITLTAEPETTDIRLRGGVAVHWGTHWRARPGVYALEARAPGYRVLREPLTVTRDADQRHRIRLEKLPGHLALTTTPAGVQVLLDGSERGTSPVTLRDLPPGAHRLELRHPRHRTFTQDVDIEGLDRTLELAPALEPLWGTVRVDSLPTGAQVRVAGTVAGATPASVAVIAGEELRLELPGHKSWQQRMDIAPGATLDLGTLTLAAADASLQISSTPQGASVILDGHHQGSTPLTLAVAPGTAHKIVLFLPGHVDASREVRLDSGEQQTLTVELSPRLGILDIELEPADARLYLDGVRQPGGTRRLELPARPHHLKVEREGYLTQERTLTPLPGTPQALVFKLQKPTAAQPATTAPTANSTTSPAATTPVPAGTEAARAPQLLLFRPDTTFTLGSSRREQGRRSDEVEHSVSLKRPFYLGVYEVTNAQYREFERTHSSSHAGAKTLDLARQPVVKVSWTDAARYCNWLSGKTGLKPFYVIRDGRVTGSDKTATGYRLPTEAEWDWAARIGADGLALKFPWGDQFPPVIATENIADSTAGDLVATRVPGYTDNRAASAPVGSYPANAKGLHDLGGNVAEWVHDHYGIAPPGIAALDPLGPETGGTHVIRGPGWRHGSLVDLRLARRDQGAGPRDDLGFRVARYAE